MDQTKKVKTKKKKVFVPKFPQILVVVSKFLRFFTNFEVKTEKKVLHEIRCNSTKITKKQFLLTNSRAVNTNLGFLGLDLHSSSPKPVNFFGAHSSLGGHGLGMPPVAPGLLQSSSLFLRASVSSLLNNKSMIRR